MLATGTIDVQSRSFDIVGVNETQTSISVINGKLRLSYVDEDGKFIQLTKTLTQDDGISVGDQVGISPALEGGLGGYAQKCDSNGVATSLTNVDWSNTTNLTSKSFVDDSGRSRTAVLLPVTLGQS